MSAISKLCIIFEVYLSIFHNITVGYTFLILKNISFQRKSMAAQMHQIILSFLLVMLFIHALSLFWDVAESLAVPSIVSVFV